MTAGVILQTAERISVITKREHKIGSLLFLQKLPVKVEN
jgi:hypothetical protein